MARIEQFETPFGTIRVTVSADGSVSYYQNGSFHSQADENGVSVCAYIHVLYEIVLQSMAKRILIIGCGGGTLATMLQRMKCNVTVVDINATAFEIARNHFKLPKKVKCVTEDGVVYLQRVQQTFDAVIVDVFGAHNTVPSCFTTKSIFRAIKNVLSLNGIMVMNFVTRNDGDKRSLRVAQNMLATGLPVRLFDWPGATDRNTLILGGGPKVTIPSGREPESVEEDMEGLVCRFLKPKIIPA